MGSATHHSRVSSILVDCLDDSFDRAFAFWTGALGLDVRKPRPGQRYVTLGTLPGPVTLRLQRVEKDPGMHLDLETDAVPKEVERLEAAGAHPKYRVKRWWVLEDPSGNAFCVIRPESAGFPRFANQWRQGKE